MPRKQTLDARTHHKERGRQGFTRFSEMPMSPGRREKDLLIYIRLQEDYNWFYQELTQKILNPKNGLHPLFIERRRNPQNSFSLVQNQFWLECRSNAWSTDQNVRSTAQCPLPLQDLLEMSVDRAVDRPNWILFLMQHRLTGRSTGPSLVHVGQPPSRLKSCLRVHRVKKLYLLFLSLSLYSLPRWRFFKSEPNPYELWANSTHDLSLSHPGEIDTQSRLLQSWRNWHTISAKSTHNFDFSDWVAPLRLPTYPLPKGLSLL